MLPSGLTRGNEMSLGQAFCIICDATGELFSNSICENCLRARTKISNITTTIQYSKCAKCDSAFLNNRWARYQNDDLHYTLVQSSLEILDGVKKLEVGIKSQEIDERNSKLIIDIKGEMHKLEFNEMHETIVRFSNGVCTTCTRKDGRYFEATVQLRSSGRTLSDEEVATLRASLDTFMGGSPDPMFFITEEYEVKGGWDVLLGSKGLASAWGRKLVQRWGGQIKTSTTVVGRKDGNDVTRLTLLYRKPAYDVGDVVSWKSELWRVSTLSSDGALMLNLNKNFKSGASWRDLEKSVVVSRINEQINVEPLRIDSSAAEFLNPVDWKTCTIKLPWDWEEVRKEIKIASVDGDWVSLPHLPVDDKQQIE